MPFYFCPKSFPLSSQVILVRLGIPSDVQFCFLLIQDGPGGSLIQDGPGGSLIQDGPGGSLIQDGPGGSLIQDGPGGSLNIGDSTCTFSSVSIPLLLCVNVIPSVELPATQFTV